MGRPKGRPTKQLGPIDADLLAAADRAAREGGQTRRAWVEDAIGKALPAWVARGAPQATKARPGDDRDVVAFAEAHDGRIYRVTGRKWPRHEMAPAEVRRSVAGRDGYCHEIAERLQGPIDRAAYYVEVTNEPAGTLVPVSNVIPYPTTSAQEG